MGSDYVRITRALGAADMLAVGTLGRLADELGIALVAEPPHPLPRLSVHQVLAARHGRQRDGRLDEFAVDTGVVLGFGTDSGGDGMVGPVLVVGSRGRMTGTLLAADVLAVDADLVGAKGGLAAVAATTDPHADGTIDPLDGHVGGRLPFTGVESEAVFGEESTSPVLLNGTPVGDHGRNDGMGDLALGHCGRGIGTEKLERKTGKESRNIRNSLAGFAGDRRRTLVAFLQSGFHAIHNLGALFILAGTRQTGHSYLTGGDGGPEGLSRPMTRGDEVSVRSDWKQKSDPLSMQRERERGKRDGESWQDAERRQQHA